MGDSTHFLFPVFPEGPVEPGEPWKAMRVNAVIRQRPGVPQLRTIFPIRFMGRLREVRQEEQGPVAVVDYHYWGLFDTSLPPFAERFEKVK